MEVMKTFKKFFTESDKFKAFKSFVQTYTIKNKFDSNLIFAKDKPSAEANARETERRLAKEGMDFYITELVVKHYKDLTDNFGLPDHTKDNGQMFLDWGIEFADGVKVILSIDPNDVYYDEHNVPIPESSAVAQVTGPRDREQEILDRLDTILNK
jgi:hypothetical protein